MGTCDMCGKPAELFNTRIEGTTMAVCKACSEFGTVLVVPRKTLPRQRTSFGPRAEIMEVLVDDYAKRIRDARSRSGLKQEEFAKKLAEKESVVAKLEAGSFRPPITLAKKLERILGVTLVEIEKETGEVPLSSSRDDDKAGFTMSDFVKKK